MNCLELWKGWLLNRSIVFRPDISYNQNSWLGVKNQLPTYLATLVHRPQAYERSVGNTIILSYRKFGHKTIISTNTQLKPKPNCGLWGNYFKYLPLVLYTWGHQNIMYVNEKQNYVAFGTKRRQGIQRRQNEILHYSIRILTFPSDFNPSFDV